MTEPKRHQTGSKTQVVEVAPDLGSGFGFELNNVYMPGPDNDQRGAISILAPLKCYWSVVETATGDRKSLTFSDALDRHGPKFKLERFRTLTDMRDELRAMFS